MGETGHVLCGWCCERGPRRYTWHSHAHTRGHNVAGSGSLGKAKKQGGGGHNWGTWEEDPEEEEKEATEEEVVMETEDGHQPQVRA
jgi:hypothetical protein